MNNNRIDKVKEVVHLPLKWERYNETLVRNETNCYAHAIGSTYPCFGFYRIGVLSGNIISKEEYAQEYYSEKQVKTLFLKDMQFLNLDCQEIVFSTKEDLLEKIRSESLLKNQYVVLLFLYFWSNGKIADFHFWRYDTEIGFSHKRYRQLPITISDPIKQWPETWNIKCISAFRITR